MNKAILTLGAILTGLSASAQITLHFNEKPATDIVVVQHALVSDLTSDSPSVVTDTITINGTEAVVPVEQKAPARYRITLPGSDRSSIDFFTSPDDVITGEVISQNPFAANLSGSTLINDINRINESLRPINEEVKKIQRGELSPDNFEKLAKDYDRILASFIDNNPKSPAVIYALISMEEPFDTYVGKLDPSLASSPLYPLLAPEIAKRNKQKELEKRKEELSSGHMDAPDFTLKNIEGKDVSLSQFKGKWVILDFWGSWCQWCIKRFPALKEAYKKYAGKLEVIGVDCGDTDAQWRAAVKRFDLPWVNVYNPSTPGNVTELYPIQGFPTKVIINPEGKIQTIVTGEDPSFYDTLSRLIK